MKIQVILLAITVTLISLAGCHCRAWHDSDDCVCPEYYSPVCGSDGVTYANECFARCENVSFTPGPCPQTVHAIIKDYGDPAVDGCGWVIALQHSDTIYEVKPDTLAEEFKVAELKVIVTYKEKMQMERCGFGFTQYPQIAVLHIVRA